MNRNVLTGLVLVVACGLIGGVAVKYFRSATAAVAPVQPSFPVAVAPAARPQERAPVAGSVPRTSRPAVVKPEKQTEKQAGPMPEWLARLSSTHEKYYPGWKQAQAGSPTVSGLAPGAPSAPAQPPVAPPMPTASALVPPSASAAAPVSPSPSVPQAAAAQTKQTGETSSTPSTGTGSGSRDSVDDNDSGGDDQTPAEPLVITRTISPFSGGAYVTLSISISEQINGLIVSETTPAGYTLVSSSPSYSKRVGSTYKWLFYGKGISNQRITYTLQGQGKGTISGSYESTSGKGTTTGSSQVGG